MEKFGSFLVGAILVVLGAVFLYFLIANISNYKSASSPAYYASVSNPMATAPNGAYYTQPINSVAYPYNGYSVCNQVYPEVSYSVPQYYYPNNFYSYPTTGGYYPVNNSYSGYGNYSTGGTCSGPYCY